MAIEHGVITPAQVILPERYEQPTLRGLLPGEATYSVPWAVWFDLEGAGWVGLDSTPQSERGGAGEMWLGRLSDGFVADVQRLEAQWRRQPQPSGFGADPENRAPLIGLITNHEEQEIAVEALKNLPGYTRHTPLP